MIYNDEAGCPIKVGAKVRFDGDVYFVEADYGGGVYFIGCVDHFIDLVRFDELEVIGYTGFTNRADLLHYYDTLL